MSNSVAFVSSAGIARLSHRPESSRVNPMAAQLHESLYFHLKTMVQEEASDCVLGD